MNVEKVLLSLSLSRDGRIGFTAYVEERLPVDLRFPNGETHLIGYSESHDTPPAK